MRYYRQKGSFSVVEVKVVVCSVIIFHLAALLVLSTKVVHHNVDIFEEGISEFVTIGRRTLQIYSEWLRCIAKVHLITLQN